MTTSFLEVKLEDDPLLAGDGAGRNDYAANCDGDDDNAISNDHEDEDGSELFEEAANQVTYLLPSLLCLLTNTYIPIQRISYSHCAMYISFAESPGFFLHCCRAQFAERLSWGAGI